MNARTLKPILQAYAMMLVGSLLLAVAISVFWEPYRLVTGGVSGLAIIVAAYSEQIGFAIPIWATNLVLNAPLLLFGWTVMGKGFLMRTTFATVCLSAALYGTALLPPIPADITLAAIFGGVFAGVGLGLVFRVSATTGGSDLAAAAVHRRWLRHYSIPKILFVIDTAIIAAGLVVFGPVNAMYAVVAVFVSSKVTDVMLEGLSFAKAAFIISDRAEPIAHAVMDKMERGVTGLQGRGMFTLREKNVLLCVVSAKELVMLKAIVLTLDASAFVIVADVREVVGEGFIAYNAQSEHMFPMQY